MANVSREDWLVVKQQVGQVKEQVTELAEIFLKNKTREEIIEIMKAHQYRFLKTVAPLREIVQRNDDFRRLLNHDLLGYFSLISVYMDYMKEDQEFALGNMVTRARVMGLMVEAFRFYVPGELVRLREVSLCAFLKMNHCFFDDTIKSYDFDLKNQHSMVQLQLLESEIYAQLNPPLFLLLLINLCRNARDHGKAQRVFITVSECGSEVQVDVSDDGKGVDENIAQRIFVGGYSTGKGYGLGLADAQEKMKAMRGSIECFSHGGINGGAKFLLRFKKAYS